MRLCGPQCTKASSKCSIGCEENEGKQQECPTHLLLFFILKKKHLSLKLKKTQINLEHHLQNSKHLVESVPLNCQISKTSLNLEVILVLLQFNITHALSKQNKQFV